MKITLFAFPGNCGCLGASGSSLVRASSARRPATRPGSRLDPAAKDRMNDRREQAQSLISSVQINEFIRTQQGAHIGAQRWKLRLDGGEGPQSPGGFHEGSGVLPLRLGRRPLKARAVRGGDSRLLRK